MNIFLAFARTLFFIFVSYQSLILTEAVLGMKPLRFWVHSIICLINSAVSTYLILYSSFRTTYLLLFLLLFVEYLIIYRGSIIKLICISEANILCLVCLRGITIAIFALALGVKLNDITASITLRLITELIPHIVSIFAILAIMHYISLNSLSLPLKYDMQRRYIFFWLTVYNAFMIYATEVYTPGNPLSFAVWADLCICVFVLMSSSTMPIYTFKLNSAIEIQKKNRLLSLELGTRKQLESALMRDAIFTTEANLTQNRIIQGLDIYDDSPDYINSEYDAWLCSVRSRIFPGDIEVLTKNLDRQNLLENYYHGVDPQPFDYRRCGKSGKYHWVRMVLRIFRDTESGDVLVFGYALDIETEKREMQELEVRAQTDLFTGLYNKMTTEALIKEEIKKSTGILLLLDVDNFKKINDRLGHEVGDRVLKYVAGIMKSCSRQNDILGRIGGDEFMIFMCDMKNISAAEKRASDILSQLQEGMYSKGKMHHITASIGIAPIDNTVKSFSDAYNRADKALYQVKHEEKNSFALYSTTPSSESSTQNE